MAGPLPERRALYRGLPLLARRVDTYEAVTEYVRTEAQPRDQLLSDQHRGTVGFALPSCSAGWPLSPAMIYHRCAGVASGWRPGG